LSWKTRYLSIAKGSGARFGRKRVGSPAGDDSAPGMLAAINPDSLPEPAFARSLSCSSSRRVFEFADCARHASAGEYRCPMNPKRGLAMKHSRAMVEIRPSRSPIRSMAGSSTTVTAINENKVASIQAGIMICFPTVELSPCKFGCFHQLPRSSATRSEIPVTGSCQSSFPAPSSLR